MTDSPAITKAQRDILLILGLHPKGARIRNLNGIAALKELALTGLVSDVYEMPGGEFIARLSPAGRKLLEETASND